jgi:hypothetical protein
MELNSCGSARRNIRTEKIAQLANSRFELIVYPVGKDFDLPKAVGRGQGVEEIN